MFWYRIGTDDRQKRPSTIIGRKACVSATGILNISAVIACHGAVSLLTTANSPEVRVTTVVSNDSDIHDLGEWFDLRGAVTVQRLSRQPENHTSIFTYFQNAQAPR